MFFNIKCCIFKFHLNLNLYHWFHIMNSTIEHYTQEQIIEVLENSEFFNYDTNSFYRNHGKVVQKYSQHLSKWILELDRNSLDMSNSINKEKIGEFEMFNLITRNRKKLSDYSMIEQTISNYFRRKRIA